MINFLKENYHKKPVLVTGGAGFIGSNLVEKLLILNAKVFVLDNFSTGKIQNLKPFLHKINLIIGDIQQESLLEKLFFKNDFFAIFHLAAISSVPTAEKNPTKCSEINVDSIKKILNFLNKKEKTPVIVFSSSSSVYGESNELCNEEMTKPNPASIYAKSKLDGELLLKNFSDTHLGSTIIALRYFNVFGNKDRCKITLGSVVPIFKKQLTSKMPITIFGTGKQLRDYVDVKRVVFANLLSAVSNLQGFHVFNIASGKSLSVIELINNLAKEKKILDPQIQFFPQREGDVKNSLADCNKFKAFVSNYFAKKSNA